MNGFGIQELHNRWTIDRCALCERHIYLAKSNGKLSIHLAQELSGQESVSGQVSFHPRQHIHTFLLPNNSIYCIQASTTGIQEVHKL